MRGLVKLHRIIPDSKRLGRLGDSQMEKQKTASRLSELVERFDRNHSDYKGLNYKEAQVRKEFLDPLFKLLGWDIDNQAGNAEAYKEVIHEDTLKIAGATKAPDYCFRIGGIRKFFVEAKKPSVGIEDDPDSAYQLRRYAWSSKLPLSVLTNFEHFAVYDCRYKPSKTDKASVARILLIRYDQLPSRWSDISLFSRESILKGTFDKFLKSRKPKGTAEVDEAFLDEIESWRKSLARVLALRNAWLTQPQLNVAVQLIIDRIVFLRICEDRGIEPYGQLQGLLGEEKIYKRMSALFQKADDRYNSGLFHFTKEKEREESPDSLTPRLEIDDRPLRDILNRLYYPESPYEFSVLPASILGQVYEKFLGSVIRLTAGHQAKVEEKEEVRKAGGVYYTPTYIVDFIVKHTMGELLRDKTPREVSNLKIVDPACGSGSFLIEAYQHLLDWHLAFYSQQPTRYKKVLFGTETGEVRLRNSEKKRILLNNVHGVDIDSQAVEVTKLSLLLKVLEGETQQSITEQFRLFNDRALPDLARNIRRGDSLVSSDVLKDQQLSLPEADASDECADVDFFDWNTEFPEIWSRKLKGFDVVIGNPPYVYRNATEDVLRSYYLKYYKSAEGNFELYKFFLERSLDLCNASGAIGMIVSATFLVQPSFEKLRRLLSEETTIEQLAPLGPKAFKDATVDTAIIVLKPSKPTGQTRISVRAPKEPSELVETKPYKIRQSRFKNNDSCVFDYRLTEEGAKVADYLMSEFDPIETEFEFGVGINTGFIKAELTSDRKVDHRYHPMVSGTGISRYGLVRTDGWIMYDADYVKSRGDRGRSLPAEHLLMTDKILVVRTRNLSLDTRIIATIDTSGAYNLNRLSNIVARGESSLYGLLGVLNSRVYNWLYSTRYYDYEIKPVYLKASPIPDVNDPKLVKLVKTITSIQAQLERATSDEEREKLVRKVNILEALINAQVEKLFGLTKNQLAIISEQL